MRNGGMRHGARRGVGTSRLAAILLGSSALVGALALSHGASAAEPAAPAGPSATRHFDIPAQPLAGALTAFGVQSGLQVAVDPAVVAGLTSPGVKGANTPERALDALLAGTGMVWRLTGPNAIVLERQAARAVSAPAAKTESDTAMVLAPVTVSGERMDRSLRDTAASVAVIDNQAIESNPGRGGIGEVMAAIPNVVSLEPSNFAPIIRGVDGSGAAVGATAFFAGVRPRLAMQVDGRAATFNEMIFGDVSMWDVEQVEVFRGPQSTVQGRNSIAGAVIVKTKDPTFTPEGKVRAIAGNHDTRQFSGVVSGPIIEDQVALRVAVDRWTSTSDLAFQPYAGENDPEDYQSTNLRAKLLVEPRKLDGFRALLTLTHSNYEGPQGETVKRPYESGVPQSINVATFNPRNTAGILETSWEINDNLTFENVFSLTDISVRRHSVPTQGNLNLRGHEGTLEPKLKFTALDQKLKGLGGLYALRGAQSEFIDLWGGHHFEDRTKTNAAFGEATLTVAEHYDLTAGLRLEQEQRDRSGGAGNYRVNFHETYNAFLPKLGAAWHVNDALTVGSTVSRGYNAGGAGITFAAPFVNYTYKPEYVWNYETYGRVDLMGGRLRLNGNLFYADYKNLQLPFSLGTNSSVIRNADEAAVYGSELGARWKATPELELFGEIGLLKTEVLSYPGSGAEGNDLPHAPALTGTVGLSYQPLPGLELGMDARYSEAYYSDAVNSPRGKTDPYWVVNAQAGYDFGGPRVFAYVKNLFDDQSPIEIYTGTTAAADNAILQRSRTFGLGMEMTF